MKKNDKGFTLAEMLIVVAIIGILIGIMVVAISNKLEIAREATDAANIRIALEKIQIALIDETYDTIVTQGQEKNQAKNVIGKVARVYMTKQNYTGYVYYTAVELKQKESLWQSIENSMGLMIVDKYLTLTSDPKNGIFYFGIDQNGSVRIASECGAWGIANK